MKNGKSLLFAAVLSLSFILASCGTNYTVTHSEEEPTVKIDSIKLATSDETHSFTSGKDFEPGRYKISSNEGTTILFVRNADGVKIASELVSNDGEGVDYYVVTLEKDWRIIAWDSAGVTLEPEGDTEFSIQAGDYQVGRDINVIPGDYSVNFVDDGSLTIFSKDGTKQDIDSDKDGDLNVTIKTGDTIRVAFSNDVAFTYLPKQK